MSLSPNLPAHAIELSRKVHILSLVSLISGFHFSLQEMFLLVRVYVSAHLRHWAVINMPLFLGVNPSMSLLRESPFPWPQPSWLSLSQVFVSPLPICLKSGCMSRAGLALFSDMACPYWSCALEGLELAWQSPYPVCSETGRAKAILGPTMCCSLAVIAISRLFIVITLIMLNSLGINEDVMCTWKGIFIVVQH